jgi:hypothetical protein
MSPARSEATRGLGPTPTLLAPRKPQMATPRTALGAMRHGARVSAPGKTKSQPAEAAQTQSAAGWYPDPDDASRQRYWDGHRWTDQRAPSQAALAAPPESDAIEGEAHAGADTDAD